MENRPLLTFFERCRLCLEKAGEIDVFNTEDLAKDIFLCTSVRVLARQKLPTKICSQCLETIYYAKKLRATALKNDARLLYLFGEDDASSDDESNENASNTANKKSKVNGRRTLSENEKQNHKKKKECKENSSSDINSERPVATISVRKDIFESSSIVTSSTFRRTDDDDADASPKKSPKKRSKYPLDTEIECPICQKSFENNKKLYLHQRNHNKNLYCPMDACTKSFATKGDLQRHIRTHTGEKPYDCEVCGRSFTQLGTLKVHREAVHGTSSGTAECSPSK